MNDFSSRRYRLRQWVLAHPVIAFPLLYIGWAYLFWTPVLLSETSVWSFPNLLWFLMGGASPLVAGLSLAKLTGGRAMLRDIGRRLWDYQCITVRWWLIILFFWLAFDLIMAGLAFLLGITSSPVNVHWSLFSEPGSLFFLLLLSFVFPAVEEVGLRGYYLETLQQHLSPIVAGLINGAVWAVWHTPFVWLPGYYANTTFHPELYWWLPAIVCQTLLIVHVYNHTRSSILAVVIFHGMMNFTGEWLRLSPALYPFMLAGYVTAAAIVVVRWQRTRTHD